MCGKNSINTGAAAYVAAPLPFVRSIDILSSKEYTYTYEDGVLTRVAEYTVTVGENEIITARTLLHTLQYTYNRDGDLVRKQFVTADGTEHTVSFEKAEDRTVAHFTAQGKDIVSHSKTDTFGRKTFDELQLGSGFLTRRFAYHDGVVTREHAENGKVKSSPTTQLVSEITFSDGRTIAYEYDAEERITKAIDSVDGVTEYTYDALGQLLTEKANGDIVNRMTYDSYGNILSKNGVQYTYDEVWRDKLLSVGTESMSYDAQGNPVAYRGRNLEWEKGRQLKCFGAHYYTYNANGIRTSKRILRGQSYSSRHDYELDGTKILRETWGGYTLIPLYDNEDAVCGIVYEGDAFYFQKNLQGDIIAITNHTGAVVARYSYDAWGVCKVKSDTSGCDIANINPFRYRGYYYDVETGLYYLQSRYYDPEIGRFINADVPELINSVNELLGLNLMCYCCNNVINCQDYLGYLGLGFAIAAGVTVSWKTAAALVAVTGFALSYVLDRNFRNALNQLFAHLIQRAIEGIGYLTNVISETISRAKSARKYFGYEDHHIVAQSDRRAESTRVFIGQYGVYTWSSYNLVAIKKTLHVHLHTNAYFAAVELVLRSCAYTQSTRSNKKYAIIAGLVLIGALLKTASRMF